MKRIIASTGIIVSVLCSAAIANEQQQFIKFYKSLLQHLQNNSSLRSTDNYLTIEEASALLGYADLYLDNSSHDVVLTFDSIEKQDSGYIVIGTATSDYLGINVHLMGCLKGVAPFAYYCTVFQDSYDNNFAYGFHFNLNGSNISGKLTVGTPKEMAEQLSYGYAHDLYGTYYSYTSNNSSSSSSSCFPGEPCTSSEDNSPCYPGEPCTSSEDNSPCIPGVSCTSSEDNLYEGTCSITYGSSDDFFSGNNQSSMKLVFSYNTVTEIVQKTKQQCQEDPASCGIKLYSTKTSNIDEVKSSIENRKIPILGYFAKYGEGKYDWIFVTPNKNVAKLEEGLDKNGGLRWSWISTNNNPGFDNIQIDDGFLIFGNAYNQIMLPGQ